MLSWVQNPQKSTESSGEHFSPTGLLNDGPVLLSLLPGRSATMVVVGHAAPWCRRCAALGALALRSPGARGMSGQFHSQGKAELSITAPCSPFKMRWDKHVCSQLKFFTSGAYFVKL